MVTHADKYIQLAVLLRAGVAGNQEAYAKFLENIAPLVKRMVAGKIPSSDVEDVVQEVLISLHKARHTYDGQRPIGPWVAAIAKFRIADYLRKHYREKQHEAVDIEGLEEIIPDVTTTDISHEYIEELLADIPEHHRQILILMHMEGYTAKEVGARLQISESAVKVTAHRALKKIREKIKL